MPAPKKLKMAIVKRLYTETDSVHTSLLPRVQQGRIDIIRVYFDSYLGSFRYVKGRSDLFEYSSQDLSLDKRRGAPTQVDRVKKGETFPVKLHLIDQQVRIGNQRIMTCYRIEITVRTFRLAEGDMDIEACRTINLHLS